MGAAGWGLLGSGEDLVPWGDGEGEGCSISTAECLRLPLELRPIPEAIAELITPGINKPPPIAAGKEIPPKPAVPPAFSPRSDVLLLSVPMPLSLGTVSSLCDSLTGDGVASFSSLRGAGEVGWSGLGGDSL